MLAALCAALIAPLVVCEIPPLADYPNHLARWFILASLPGDAALARFYAPHWSVIPNLALDVMAPPLMRILPVHVAGRMMIAASVLLPVLGAVAYGRAMGGRWWPLGAGLLAYCNCLMYGFLNFSFSLGLALLLAAAWLRWRERFPIATIVLAVVGAPMLFACHLMGLVFFGFLIGGAELVRAYDSRHRMAEAVRRGGVLLLIVAAPAALYAMSDLRQLGGDAVFLPPADKLTRLVDVFSNYHRLLDRVTAAVAIGLPVLCVALRRGRVPALGAVPMLLLAIAFLALPYAWKGTFHLDTRLAVMLAVMLFAGFVPMRWPRWFSSAVAAVLAGLFVLRMGLLTVAWTAHQADIADIRDVLAPVQPGQAVYVVAAGIPEALAAPLVAPLAAPLATPSATRIANPRWRLLSDGTRTDIHLGALAVIERRAWWPFAFDNAAQQPLETREPYRTLAVRIGDLPDRGQAAAADVCGFDYVLLTGADTVAALPPERFQAVRKTGFATLYRIVRCRP
ncbi:MAG: hypothetical protein ACJ8AW_19820 [Rhodopila sp.]